MHEDILKKIIIDIKNKKRPILVLPDENLTSTQIKNLLDAILETDNAGVVSIDFSHNNLGTVVGKDVSDNVNNTFNQKTLSQSVVALAAFLKKYNGLLCLNLCNCQLKPQDFEILFKALKENDSLLCADFSFNQFNSESAEMLGTFLQKNQSVVFMNLFQTDLNVSAGEVLRQSLNTNSKLMVCNLANNDLSSYTLTKIKEILSKNFEQGMQNLDSFPPIPKELALELFRQYRSDPSNQSMHPLFLIYKHQLEKQQNQSQEQKKEPSQNLSGKADKKKTITFSMASEANEANNAKHNDKNDNMKKKS